MYYNGDGVSKDYPEALKWSRKAADQGEAADQTRLGQMYENGQGVPQDDAEAVKWYRKAADQNFARAQANLGVAYAVGQGVPRDYVQAYLWLSLAASRLPDQRKNLDFVTRKLTPEQIAEAQRAVRDWKSH
jgi:TPR repeat protein